MQPLFTKLLIANRGEIACRVIRTARRLGIKTVAVFSDADAAALHVEMADEAVRIGAAPAAESYLDIEAVIAAAKATGAQAVHPGYGFLSENPAFVEAVEAAGLVFVGPSAAAIRSMGLKDEAKRLMASAGVPIVPGYHGKNQDAGLLAAEAEKIGYPMLIKACAGGGGKGIRRVDAAADFADNLAGAKREALSAFGDDSVLIEKFITAPRHIEVQIFGDQQGNVVHLFERDCSLQRRHQKVIEEAPAPGMSQEVRSAMTEAAVRAAKAIHYTGAGTIEFIVDGSGPLRPDGFWFMEMNTRLQVEHPVTEMITGQDLVEWQLRVAAGEALPLRQQTITMSGHAFEARLYAEDPANDFLPQTGTIRRLAFSDTARNECGVRTGDTITPFYDPMIAKIIVHEQTRPAALARLEAALRQTRVAGAVTNAGFLAALAAHPGFGRGEVDTGLIERDLVALVAAPPPSETALFVAALVVLDIDMEAPLVGWRLWGAGEHQVRLEWRGANFERRVILDGKGAARLAGAEQTTEFVDVRRDSDLVQLRAGSMKTSISAAVASYRLPRGHAVSVQLGGETYEFIRPDPLVETEAHGDPKDEIHAPMAGTVIAVNCRVGDVVTKGDKLVVVEAMKMETSLAAPRDGVLAEVLCRPGVPVEGGALMLRLEARE